jgi:hypothetical protein
MSNVLNYLKAIVAVITAIAVYVVPNIPGNDTVATDDGVGPEVGA